MNRTIRRLTLVSLLASGVALAQSTPPPPSSGPSTGNSYAPEPRPSTDNAKPATGSMGAENETTPGAEAKPNDARSSGTGGSGEVGTGTSTKKSKAKKPQNKPSTGAAGTDTNSNGQIK